MARRNGVAEDLFKITATLPWWMGIAFAVAAYVLLQPYAVLETSLKQLLDKSAARLRGK